MSSKVAKEFAEMRLNNDFLSRALKTSYSKIADFKFTIKELKRAVKNNLVLEQDLASLKRRRPLRGAGIRPKNRLQVKGLAFREAKDFAKKMGKEMDSYFKELIKVALEPMSGYLRVPGKAPYLPVHLKRSSSYH